MNEATNPQPPQNPIAGQAQSIARHQIRQQCIRLESYATRIKRAVWAEDLLQAASQAREAEQVSQQLKTQLDNYLPFLTNGQSTGGVVQPVSPTTYISPRRTVDYLRSRLDRGGFQKQNAASGLSKHQVIELYAKSQKARGELLTPSELNWPEAVGLLKPSTGLEMLFNFGDQRHRMWDYRQQGVPKEEWQNIDDYLKSQSFCNAYRVLDAVSQRAVEIANDEISRNSFAEQLLRVLLLKVFNEKATYDVLREGLGEEPQLSNFAPQRYKEILTKALEDKRVARLFRPAYRPGNSLEGWLASLQQMIDNHAAQKIEQECHNLYDIASHLRQYDGVGYFLAAQWTLDLAYGPHLSHSLDDFCLAGPGAINGIGLCFEPRSWSYREINDAILMLSDHDILRECFQLVTGHYAPRLEGRLPFPMDVQNFCCEGQKLLLLSADAYEGQGGKQPPPKLPPWWIDGPSKEKEEARMLAEIEERRRTGKESFTALNLLARLKQAKDYATSQPAKPA